MRVSISRNISSYILLEVYYQGPMRIIDEKKNDKTKKKRKRKAFIFVAYDCIN